MRISNFLRTVTVAGLLSFGSMAAFGNVLGSNDCVGGSCGGTLDIFSNLPGTLLNSNSVTFTALDAQSVAKYSGVLRSAVYRNAGNTLDFYYQFLNDAGSVDAVGRLTMTDFAGFSTDVGYRMDDIDGAGNFTVATQAALSSDRSASGGTIGFSFGPGLNLINPGDTSATLVIRTNALEYTAGSVTTQNGAVYTTAAFAPAVPEPGTYAMMGGGLIALAFLRRRK
ncbi:MAG: PEP-CTERM sorting domain-containing protein [Bryobacteraceae bacterium]